MALPGAGGVAGVAVRVLAGRYELVRFVGRGGMGEVWEGRDRLIERRVAVKLLPHEARDTAGAELFFREARTAGALHHPGAVTVHDLGQDEADGALFLVMEFVEGRDLAQVVHEDGPPPVRVALDWAAQAAAALSRAHASGIVHRDLKPANLMVDSEGRVKILDFGIARFMESTNRSSKVMGTLAYMPPERFDDASGDARSDLYSFGCVLHELLTGNVPFEASGPLSMMKAHLDTAPSRPGEVREGVPPAVDDLVLALLAKDPADRPADADAVHRILRTAATTVPAQPGTPREPATADAPASPTEPNPAAVHRSDTECPETSARPAAAVEPSDTPTHAAATTVADRAKGSPGAAAGEPDHGGPAEPPAGPSRRRFLWLTGVAVGAVGGGVAAALAFTGGSSDDLTAPTNGPGNPVPGVPGLEPGFQPWAISPGHGPQHPVVADGTVYFSADDRLQAVSARTGTRQWEFYYGGGLGVAPSAPANGVLYLLNADHVLYAVNSADGSVKWTFKTADTGTAGSTPVAAGGTVYFGSGPDVHALDAATGQPRWRCPTGGNIMASPAVADGVVHIGSDDTKFYAIDAATGNVNWTYGTGDFIASTPAVAGQVVYIPSSDGTLHAIDRTTGTAKWTYGTGGAPFTSPAVADGLIVAGRSDHRIYALDAATGTKKWSRKTADLLVSPPAIAHGIVYFGSPASHVYALDAQSSITRWSFATQGSVTSSPEVAHGLVYIGSNDGTLYALDAATGVGPQ